MTLVMYPTSVTELNRLLQIIFLGIRGKQYQGDIALDMLKIGIGDCTGNAMFAFMVLM